MSPEQINEIVWYFACWYKFNSHKLIKNFWGGRGQKCVWPVWSQDSKIDCISGMNWYGMNRVFAYWWNFRKGKNNFNHFWMSVIKIRNDHLIHETLRSAELFMNWPNFLHVDCDAIILVRPASYSAPLTFKC